ncbi:unnamed protein product [Chrysodeixis includens]|uniref:Telomere-associated protein RIF1 n=1 Tax=Chrysodeixis includens TaxID=689277 RepID=A0A9N8Q019_CHRIL|nr:unnamed protein product [Chrysodeixis includens]
MPENLQSALDKLEDQNFSTVLSRMQNYTTIYNALEKEEAISFADIQRLQTICVFDLKDNIKHTSMILKILLTLVTKIGRGMYCPHPDLLPSALAVIHIVKTTALLSKVESLKELCFETLLSFPDETLIATAECNEEVVEIVNLYCHARIPSNIRLQTCSVLHRLLLILPPEKKKKFVEKGVNVWFSKIIPTIMNNLISDMTLEVMEMLTEDIVPLEYCDSPQWYGVLECISIPTKYPAILRNLIDNGHGSWARLWIVFIKLLKSQITLPQEAIGTPINSMLPVVETAFKLDVENRCRAFQCWIALTDTFATETNESNIHKRLRLLMIPLKSNNAKVEKTAIAKFRSWYHIILKFHTKIDRFADSISISFLLFSFGRYSLSDSDILVPGLISPAVTKLCMKAVVEMVGHVNCDGCTELPKLTDKIISTKHLVNNWNHWIYSLTRTVMMTVNSVNGLTKQQLTCLWKSFLMTIGELPENNVRKDLFTEMLHVLTNLVKECKFTIEQNDMVFNVLFLSVFDEDPSIRQLLKTKSDVNEPLFKLINCALDPALKILYQRLTIKEIISCLRPLTDTILDPAMCAPFALISWIFNTHSFDVLPLMLWAALVESIYEKKIDVPVQFFCGILLWPLDSKGVKLDDKKYIKIAATRWQNLYDMFEPTLVNEDVRNELLNVLTVPLDADTSSVYMKLSATLSILKYKLEKDNFADSSYEREIGLLEKLVNNISCFEDFEDMFPLLIETVSVMLTIVASFKNETLARHLVVCATRISAILMNACDKGSEEIRMSYLGRFLNPLDLVFQVNAYSNLIPIICDEIIDISTLLSKQSVMKSPVIALLKTVSAKMIEEDVKYTQIKNLIHEIVFNAYKLIIKPAEVKIDTEFSTPMTVDVPKKVNKKGTSIVNTVVENGEEYVVVKSNWKFNPRKLTENQKEKLQRKREDIPALYQDLSQSQDEFKLATWKTDSQDTSNSSRSESKSNQVESNATATEILKNLPSSNVVPKILENIFSENDKKDGTSVEDTKNPVAAVAITTPVAKNVVDSAAATTPKSTGSPRLAFKDRVFRNVRNLIEKSGNMQNSEPTVDLNKTENVIKTPTQSKMVDSANIVNSAPPLLSAHRPSRVKRKPKKFDGLTTSSAKKTPKTSQDQIVISDDNSQSDSEKILKETSLLEPVVELCDILDKSTSVKSKRKLADSENPPSAHKADENKNNASKNKDGAKVRRKGEIDSTKSSAVENKEKYIMVFDTNIVSIDVEELKKSEELEDKNKKSPQKNKEVPATNDENKSPPTKKEDDNLKSSEKPNSLEESKSNNKSNEKETSNEKSQSPIKKEVTTPQRVKETEEPKSSAKKNSVKKSRIEKELAIDTVEGNPFLKQQSQKRMTRKALVAGGDWRKKLVNKLDTVKTDLSSGDRKQKRKSKVKDSDSSNSSNADSQDTDTNDQVSFSQDVAFSDDVIESSQDSSITVTSVKSTKKTPNTKYPIVALVKNTLMEKMQVEDMNESQSILDSVVVGGSKQPQPSNQESRDDIELPLNKTVEEKSQGDHTENMDTEPIEDNTFSDVIILDDEPSPVTVSDETIVGPETQEIADADTQPTDPKEFMDSNVTYDETSKSITIDTAVSNAAKNKTQPPKDRPVSREVLCTNDLTITLTDPVCVEVDKETASSPSSFRDEVQKRKDFLNNTLEISPIKNMSPDRNKKSPSPDTSNDYVVIKLTSPVHSNGEPYEKCGSPEVFTDDKGSPDKRDQSPPRVEVTVTNTSPSSSLSLKKNRPQVRSGGRAAQMLGLCVPDKVIPIAITEKNETEEAKKTGNSSTPARRNLRILYNSASENVEPVEIVDENEDTPNFLKFRRSLPAVDSSPSCPILKRKLIEITDDGTISPVSKRKRVSFHDPPVSTTMSVQKYIEPGSLRSPQNSANKRAERQLRQFTKSPKRLEHAFKLDTVLTKTIESFSENQIVSIPDDTQPSSLDETPVVEIVRASELNDTDPICPELLDCKDSIEKIAGELSSPAMKALLVKELVGKVETIGDLAKMTELEVNRLCIKAPKVKVARKVLSDYASKVVENPIEITPIAVKEFDVPMTETDLNRSNMEVQTDVNVCVEVEMQTVPVATSVISAQTDNTPTADTSMQTNESGSTSTSDIVKSCLKERQDFFEQIGEQLEESSIQKLSEKLSCNAMTDVLLKKVTPTECKNVLNRILEHQCNNPSTNKISNELSFVRDYLCGRYDSKDLILFCSEILKSMYDKPA